MNNNPLKYITLVVTCILLLFGVYAVIFYKDIGSKLSSPKPISKGVNDIINLTAGTHVEKFKNYDDLIAFLDERNTNSQAIPPMMGDGIMRRDVDLAAPTVSNQFGFDSAQESSGMPGSYSTTNVQVAGVDEADIVKTDGKYIYSVSGNGLFITEAFPADKAKVLSRITLRSHPENIYINENFLVVYGAQSTPPLSQNTKPALNRQSPYTFLMVFDVQDHTNPKRVRNINFEGSYTDSRMIGDFIYMITTLYNPFPYHDIPVPVLFENDTRRSTDPSEPRCYCPPVYHFDIPYNSYQMTTVAAIPITDSTTPVHSEVYLLDNTQTLFASQDNLYITFTQYISEDQLIASIAKEILWPTLSARDQRRVNEIETISEDILSSQEKYYKIQTILDRAIAQMTSLKRDEYAKELERRVLAVYNDIANEVEKTVVHKIALNGGSVEYKTYGSVPGHVLNQFSMDEYRGFFRIATTQNQTYSRFAPQQQNLSRSNVYVLDESLRTVGKVEGLGMNEQIYSVRFMGDRGYLVTFRRTDPLFALDLSDPRNPRALGELKIPGFSTYLHPYDQNHLIGFGRDATEAGQSLGLKLALFDVADVHNPKEVDSYTFGDQSTNSLALNDHKAFLFSREKNLLVIPVEQYGERFFPPVPMPTPLPFMENRATEPGMMPSADRMMMPIPQTNSFNGVFVFRITQNGFELRDKIQHGQNDDYIVENQFSPQQEYGYTNSSNAIKRALFIDDTLYTVSDQFIKLNTLDTLQEIHTLPLRVQRDVNNYDYQYSDTVENWDA